MTTPTPSNNDSATPTAETSTPPTTDLQSYSTKFAKNTTCLICCTDDLPLARGITPCGHDDVCASCHLRLRFLHSEKRCPICKNVNEKIIVDADNDDSDDGGTAPHKPYDDYGVWGDDLGAGFVFRENVSMFFRQEYYDAYVVPLFSFACTIADCGHKIGGKKSLLDHLKKAHGLHMCNLCITAKRDFISQLPRYTANQLKKHMSKGIGGIESGDKGHPMCDFCAPQRFYDLTKLHEHLNKHHYKCHVCERQGRSNQFFKNYDTLAIHFDKAHYLCRDAQCLAARFVVFENEIDLRAHERQVHGGTVDSSSSKIKLEFRVRRTGMEDYEGERQQVPDMESDFSFGVNGEAFVPEALPQQQQENEPEISDPVHAERTRQLREEAARMRREVEERERPEAFPTLAEANSVATGQGGGNLVGWTSDKRAAIKKAPGVKGRVTKDDFPSLPTAKKSSTLVAARRMANGRGAGGGASWTAQKMAASRQQQQQLVRPSQGHSANYASNAARINKTSNLTSDNFPTLKAPPKKNNKKIAAVAPSPYSAAMNYAKKKSVEPTTTNRSNIAGHGQQPYKKIGVAPKKPPNLTSNDFPTLSTAPKQNNVAAARQQAYPKLAPAPIKPPNLTSNNYPTLSQTSSQSKTFLQSQQSAMSPEEQLSTIKTILGPPHYKKLKSYTKQFALNEITPHYYIDESAKLFSQQIKDPDFWTFMPILLNNCPDENNKVGGAMEYLASLRTALEREEGELRLAATTGSGGGSANYAAARHYYAKQQKQREVVPTARRGGGGGEKKPQGVATTTWGSSSANKITNKNKNKNNTASKTSVVAAAVQEQENKNMGTATSYMAKMKVEENRKKVAENSASLAGGGKKNRQKKKKKDELRNLAFGK